MAGVQALRGLGVSTFLEAGPGGVLSGMGPACLEADTASQGSDAEVSPAAAARFVPALRDPTAEEHSVVTAVGELFVRGTDVDWKVLFPEARRVDLPTYAFQHRRYWLEATSSMEETTEAELKGAANKAALVAKLTGLEARAQLQVLLDLILAEAATALAQQSVEVELDAESPFLEVGFNSLSAVELRNRLVEATGVQITPMLLFDYPTPEYVADLLLELLFEEAV
jgi:acyl transferase domain-containing protein